MGRRGGGGSSRSSSRSSGSSGGFFSRSKPAARPAPAPARNQSTRAAPPPAAAPRAAPPPAQPAPQQGGGGGMLSGIGSTIVQGMAFGTGSAVAHRAVDAVVGPRSVQVEHVGQEPQQGGAAPAAAAYVPQGSEGVCGDEYRQFNQCLSDNTGNIASCKFYYDVLSQCQNSNAADSQWK